MCAELRAARTYDEFDGLVTTVLASLIVPPWHCADVLDAIIIGALARIKESDTDMHREISGVVVAALLAIRRATGGAFHFKDTDLAIHVTVQKLGIKMSPMFAASIIEAWATAVHRRVGVYAGHATLVWLARHTHPDLLTSEQANTMIMAGLLNSANMAENVESWKPIWAAAMGSPFMDDRLRALQLEESAWGTIRIWLCRGAYHQTLCAVSTALLTQGDIPADVSLMLATQIDDLRVVSPENAERLATQAMCRGVYAYGMQTSCVDTVDDPRSALDFDALKECVEYGEWWRPEKGVCTLPVA